MRETSKNNIVHTFRFPIFPSIVRPHVAFSQNSCLDWSACLINRNHLLHSDIEYVPTHQLSAGLVSSAYKMSPIVEFLFVLQMTSHCLGKITLPHNQGARHAVLNIVRMITEPMIAIPGIVLRSPEFPHISYHRATGRRKPRAHNPVMSPIEWNDLCRQYFFAAHIYQFLVEWKKMSDIRR